MKTVLSRPRVQRIFDEPSAIALARIAEARMKMRDAKPKREEIFRSVSDERAFFVSCPVTLN